MHVRVSAARYCGVIIAIKSLKSREKNPKQVVDRNMLISLAKYSSREQHCCLNWHQHVPGPTFLFLPLIFFPQFSLYKGLFAPFSKCPTPFQYDFHSLSLWISCFLQLLLACEPVPKLTFAHVTSREGMLGSVAQDGVVLQGKTFRKGCTSRDVKCM